MPKQKAKTALERLYGRSANRYLELIHQFPLRYICSDEELDEAIRVINLLIDRKTRIAPEEDYLDIISDIVEKYEEETIPMGNTSDEEMLVYLMELREITQVQLAKDTGIATSTVSEVLSGKRKLTRKQIEKLATYFNVSPAVFHTNG